jgi:hypothetical protein
MRDPFFSSRRYGKTLLVEQWVAKSHAAGLTATIAHLDGRLEHRHPDGTVTWSKVERPLKGEPLMFMDEEAWKVLIPESEQ